MRVAVLPLVSVIREESGVVKPTCVNNEKVKPLVNVILGVAIFCVAWWGIVSIKIVIDFIPLSWFETVVTATGYSELQRIIGVRLSWVVDFFWPVLLAGVPVTMFATIFKIQNQNVWCLGVGCVTFIILFVVGVLPKLEPRFMPDGLSYMVMIFSFTLTPLMLFKIQRSLRSIFD